jgi:hypothetical protein
MPSGLNVVTDRPNWLTAGTRHMLVLAAPIALGALIVLQRQAAGLPILGSSVRLTDAVLARLRHIGLPLLGLTFFAFWTIVYTGLWAANPDEAFGGIGERPRLAD